MGLFSPYQRKHEAAPAAETPQPETAPAKGPAKKSIPTPTRKAAEQARRDRINPQLSPREAKARHRQASREARLDQMKAVDQTPARALVRDFVDSRWALGEWLMPMLLVTVLIALASQQTFADMAGTMMTVALLLSYGMLLATIFEIALQWRNFKKVLQARSPGESTKGLLFYFANRWISIRGLRQPKPRFKRGDKLT